MVQIVKNLPAMRETCVQSLGREDPLERSMATHSSILACRIPMDRGAWWAAVHVITESDTNELLSTMVLVLFLVWEDARIWGHWNSSKMPIWLSKGLFTQSTVYLILFFIPNSSQVALSVGNYSGLWLNPLELASKEHSFVFLVHSRFTAEISWLIRGNFGENNLSMNLHLQ